MTKQEDASAAKTSDNADTPVASMKCGLVMPISTIDGLLPSHWQDVKSIICEALPAWSVSLVSDGDDAGVIQRRIVERLYTDRIVIVDVSARNPNVMFELGMRLAFDKPTVIIKDDVTVYPFDVGPNEYVEYPRDLRFHRIVAFQARLGEKIAATVLPGHTTFLRSFGSFHVASIETKEVSTERLIVERLERIESSIAKLSVPRPWKTATAATAATAAATATAATATVADVLMSVAVNRYIAICIDLGIDNESARKVAKDMVRDLGSDASAEEITSWFARVGLIPLHRSGVWATKPS